MFNKVMIGISVFLVMVSGGLGAYAYTLSQQIGTLGQALTDYQAEQTARISSITGELTAIDSDLADFKTEALDKIDAVDEDLGNTRSEIKSVQGEMNDKIASVTSQRSDSVINAVKIYQKVSQASVRITDGGRLVGSGFVFDARGHVVTAYHVVEDLTKIEVVLSDGSVSAAIITGSSRTSDIAVLTLKSIPSIEPLPLADSAALTVGQPVAVIGNPLNLSESLTSGIISQLNRYQGIDYNSLSRRVANLIQFDAAVNSGSSGGPLLNAQGELIGIVIARVKPDQGDGINYAVSSNKLKRVAAAIINQGHFDYPLLGVDIIDLTPGDVQDKGLASINGVLVSGVSPGGPAGTAGIRIDDIIIGMGGKTMKDTSAITCCLGEYKSPDDTATITVLRGKSRLDLSLKVGKSSL